ncbi:hypothetical protein D3C85_1501510 [compost metagenome]
MTPQHDRVLTGHQGEVADFIGSGIGHVAGGEDVVLTDDFQMRIDMQATQVIALGWNLLSQRTGANAGGPDHGVGIDARAVGQRHTASIHRNNRGFQVPFHACGHAGFDDGLSNFLAH